LAAAAEVAALCARVVIVASGRGAEGERSFLGGLGAGCLAPLAGFATLAGSTLTMTALVGAPDGRLVRVQEHGAIADAVTIGKRAAAAWERDGGATLLAEALAQSSVAPPSPTHG
ncbi:MAG: hypothetical protein ACKOFO_04020, partial [Gemmatimonadota bacterium]